MLLKKVIKHIERYYYIHVINKPEIFYRKLGVKIGKRCTFIGDNISFSSEPYLINIGNDVRVSFDVCFITHDGGTHVLRKQNPEVCIYGQIIVGNNVFIGARSIILPNTKIGNNSIVGAGSLVTKDIPDNEVWGGIPAHKICTVDEYKKKNEKNFSYILNKDYNTKKKVLLNEFLGQ